jgi:hypothetical protein
MCLIHGLATHYKPLSIVSQIKMPANIKCRKKLEMPMPLNNLDCDMTLQDEMEEDISVIRQLTETLYSTLVAELKAEPFECSLEEFVVLKGKLTQSLIEKEKLQQDLIAIERKFCDLNVCYSATRKRLQRQENNMMTLRKELLQSNFAGCDLQAVNTRLIMELEKRKCNEERLKSKLLENNKYILKVNADLANEKHSLTCLQKKIIMTEPGQQINEANRDANWISVPKRPRREISSDVIETRILYYAGAGMTPRLTSLPKSIDEITLRDFKNVTKKLKDSFSFYFMSLDLKLGAIKRQVCDDDDVLPG